MPKVSVIVPVYNTEKYLRGCLDSLVNQTLEDIEIVVVNDGSKDSSPEIIKEYADKYPGKIVHFSQENSGQAVARNRAIAACTGDYIGFLDSDDSAETDMFQKMYDNAISHDADLVVCDYKYISAKKTQIKRVKAFRSNEDMFIDCFVDPWNKLYKANVLKTNGISFPEGYFYEDTGWFVKSIPFVVSFTKIDEALVCHYKREGSTMTALDDKRVQHIFAVMSDIWDFYEKNGLDTKFKDELEYFSMKILLCSSFRRISRVIDKNIRKELVNRTFDCLNARYPQYKSNKYLSNKKLKYYIKFLSKKTAGLVLLMHKCSNAINEWRE